MREFKSHDVRHPFQTIRATEQDWITDSKTLVTDEHQARNQNDPAIGNRECVGDSKQPSRCQVPTIHLPWGLSSTSYIERNPVRAGLVQLAEEYAWSSARAHVIGRDHENFMDFSAWRETYTAERWRATLRLGIEEEALQERLRLATLTGRPFGSDQFIDQLELTSNRRLRCQR